MLTDASHYLAAMARRVAAELVARTGPRAILLTGSAAEGLSDEFSDIDLIVYHETLPSSDRLAAARDALRAVDVGALGGQEAESYIEQFTLRGVTCQVAHLTVASWERDMASVLEQFEPGTVVEKALSGLLAGVALHGNDLIERWQARAAHYPEELARATVERHLQVFPLWIVAERWQTRDATIFYYQSLVETSLNLLAVLAGLNRLYCSSFQFKRLHRFAGKMSLAPERLAERLDSIFALDPVEAGIAMERLIAETVDLVETHMPEIDTALVRGQIGVRHQPWDARGGSASAGSGDSA